MSTDSNTNMQSTGIINRELSWLDFNNRVLDEAYDPEVPLLDRLKFIAISGANLDEFFMVRVAGLRRQLSAGIQSTDPSGMTVEEQLTAIQRNVELMYQRQYRCLQQEILPALEEKETFGIFHPRRLDAGGKNLLKQHFEKQIMPVLTPVAVDPSHPFPIIANGMIEIAVLLRRPGGNGWCRALVEVPDTLPRFIPVEWKVGERMAIYLPIEEVIIQFLQLLFANYEIIAAFPFRLTRDMDFSVDTDGVSDLLLHVENQLRRHRLRQPIRLEIIRGCDRRLSQWLIKQFRVDRLFVYRIPGPLALSDFFALLGPDCSDPRLMEPEWPPLPSPLIEADESMFTAINRQQYLPLFLPYEKFSPIISLLEEAAEDPNVLAIKQTLYRVSGDSPIVRALRQAAENGKQVTVILEVKARFDEERNISWARHLEEAGVHVIYGIVGLKIHCKALLIVRREENRIHRYLHLATGNYNDRTARLYTDAGIFTDDAGLCSDVAALFNVMTGYSEPPAWEQVTVAPFNLRQTMLELINRETRLSSKLKPGSITAKMNALVDPEVIKALIKAAEAGVKINLVIRGTCCLKPGRLIDNITVISIVDRYLEHTRLFRFGNGGNTEYYMSSADWMPRNLNRRIELMFPIHDQGTRDIVDNLLQMQLSDQRKGRRMRADGTYKQTSKAKRWSNTRSQMKTYAFFQKRLNGTGTRSKPAKKMRILRNPPRTDNKFLVASLLGDLA